MLGVDTNVLLRFFVEDDAAQHAAAVKRLLRMEKSGDRALVTTVVVAELAWGLRSIYGYDRAAIASVVDALLEGGVFEVDDRAAVAAAARDYKLGGADLADLLMLSVAKERGARGLLTFDKALLKLGDCERP